MRLQTSDVVPISEARARLEEEHAGLVLLDEAETGLRQLLADQRVSNPELMSALSE